MGANVILHSLALCRLRPIVYRTFFCGKISCSSAQPRQKTQRRNQLPIGLPSSVHLTSITSVCALCRFVSSRTAAEQLRHGVAELANQWRSHMSLQGVLDAYEPAADLGMFSMFGRTGAPTKRRPQKGGPHKRTILPHSLTVCFRKAGLKLPVSCCCNSSVHCSCLLYTSPSPRD